MSIIGLTLGILLSAMCFACAQKVSHDMQKSLAFQQQNKEFNEAFKKALEESQKQQQQRNRAASRRRRRRRSPQRSSVHPELVRLHYLGLERPIYSYGALIVVGIAAGLLVGVARAPRFGVPRFDELAVGLLGVVGGLMRRGAALRRRAVARHRRRSVAARAPGPRLLRRPRRRRRRGLRLLPRLARAHRRRRRRRRAPGLALGHAFGRVGCLLGGCCYGRVVDAGFPLAVRLHGAWRHPVQLYEAAGLVAIAIVTAMLPRRRAGAIFGAYVVAYALLRLVDEHWRGDDVERGLVARALSTSQLIALAVLVALAAGAALLYREKRTVTHVPATQGAI